MGLFAAQTKLLARLQFAETGLLIRPAETVRSVLESKQQDRTLYLMLHRYRPSQDDHGSSRVWDEDWMTVLALKYVGGPDRAAQLQAEAAPYLNQVIGLLDGWVCRPEVLGPVKAIPGPDPLITDGYGYFPLLFRLRTQTASAENPDS